MRKGIASIIFAIFLSITFCNTAFAETLGTNVTTTICPFKVTMNGQIVDNAYREYPFIVYKDITYFPMTYWDMRFLGVSNTWSAENGSVIVTNGSTAEYKPTLSSKKNKANNVARINTGAFKVNGKVVDNSKEEYPILSYKDVPYFPLTWDWCQEFGWNINFNGINGLVVTTTKQSDAVVTNDNSQKIAKDKLAGDAEVLSDWNIIVNDKRINGNVLAVNNAYLVPIKTTSEAMNLKYKHELKNGNEKIIVNASHILRNKGNSLVLMNMI